MKPKAKPAESKSAESKSPDWGNLLKQALTEPGTISKCYSRFHGYSFSNQMLAAFQLAAKNMPMEPIATYKKWTELGRQVKKGEKALSLYVPVTVKNKAEKGGSPAKDVKDGKDKGEAGKDGDTSHFFVMKPGWFSLGQTEGAEYTAPTVDTGWDKARALSSLGITEEPFHYMDGNAQGYATKNSVAVSPVAELPHKTLFHEIAHVMLGHTGEGDMADSKQMAKNLKEVEAESVAFLCVAALELPGMSESRGYIQAWLKGEELPEKSVKRILNTANKVLSAGREQTKENLPRDPATVEAEARVQVGTAIQNAQGDPSPAKAEQVVAATEAAIQKGAITPADFAKPLSEKAEPNAETLGQAVSRVVSPEAMANLYKSAQEAVATRKQAETGQEPAKATTKSQDKGR